VKNLPLIMLTIVAAIIWATQRHLILQDWLDSDSPYVDILTISEEQDMKDMVNSGLASAAIRADIWYVERNLINANSSK